MSAIADGRSTTELRVLISEDSQGNLDVDWEGRLKGTDIFVPLRPSHVAGQLFAASFVVMAKSYKGYKDKLADAVAGPLSAGGNSEGERKSDKGKKKHSKVSSSR